MKETTISGVYGSRLSAATMFIAGLVYGTQGFAAEPRLQVEEVVVTAQRREQNAQDVAISMTVFDQRQISNANMVNSKDIATYTPSLSTNERFGPELTTFSIRGFSQALRTTATVATYFSEVVAPRGQYIQTSGDGAGPGELFDLQNVQVLKGPQGTLFGRNSTGGAVLLTPRAPEDGIAGYAEFSAGNFSMQRKQAVLNLPISDDFKLRFGVDINERDGHLNNTARVGARDLGNVNYEAYRLSALWDVSDSVSNLTLFSYVDSESHGYTSQLFACNPDVTVATFSVLTGPGCQAQLDAQREAGNTSLYDVVSTVKTPVTAITVWRMINTTTWEISDSLSLKNIISYAHLETLNGQDVYGTRFPETTAIGPISLDPNREFTIAATVNTPGMKVTSQQTWVEELQLQGRAFDSRMVWQTGVYYENSLPDDTAGYTAAVLISCDLATIESADPADFNCNDPLAGALGTVLRAEAETEYTNIGVFGQTTIDISRRLGVTGGLRYTSDETEGYGKFTRHSFAGIVPLPAQTTVSRPAVKSDELTGLAELNFKPTDDAMVYAKYVRGYRQGSVNAIADVGVDTFAPEIVDNYEIGAKTAFSGWLAGRLNVAVFINDLTDMQLQSGYVSPNRGPTTAIFNAGKAEINGFEFDGTLLLSSRLSLDFSYSRLDTELIEQDDNRAKVEAAAGPVAGQAYSPLADIGDELPYTPEESYVATLNYKLPLQPAWGDLVASVTYVYTGEQRTTATSSSPFSTLDDYSLLNYNLNWRGALGLPLDMSVFVTNAQDEEFTTYIAGSYNSLGIETRMPGVPRMAGARLKYSFGD